jgi:arylsulfatase A-like enzyme
MDTPRSFRPSKFLRRSVFAGRRGVLPLVVLSLLAGLPFLHEGASAGAAAGGQAPNDIAAGDDGATTPPGYWLVGSDGGIFGFGSSTFFGSTGAEKLNKPIVGMESTRTGNGYWLVASDGGIFSFGGAQFYGSTGAINLNKPIVGMAATPSGWGYWLVASDGGIFSYGDAGFFGSTGNIKLNKPIVGMAPTPTGRGYWLVASDGGIFSFGDAHFFGSTGNIKLNKPITGITTTPTAAGYWMVASDGGIFSFGDAQFWGSVTQSPRVHNIVSLVRDDTGAGYWEIGSDGSVAAFGDATDLGSAHGVSHPVVGAAGFPTGDGLPPQPVQNPTGPQNPTGSTTPTAGTPQAATGTPAGFTARAGGKVKPNVLFILVDDARADGVMDVPQVLPKTKQWLAQAGTTFDQGYATTSLCCPERATIWSGRVEHNNGVVDNYSGDNLDHNWISPRYLQDDGYRTALVGKFITDWNYRYEPPHFDQYAAFQGGYVDEPFMEKNPGDTTYKTVREMGDTTDVSGQIASNYIQGFAKNNPGQPWFMQVAPHAPHDLVPAQDPRTHPGGCDLKTLYSWPSRYDNVPLPPYNPDPAVTVLGDPGTPGAKANMDPYVRNNSFSSSCGEITWEGQMRTLMPVDDMVDQIMTTLQQTGQLSNTMVIFTSDNGFSFGERGLSSKGMPYREHVLLPTMMRWDGVFPAGVVDHRPIGGEDFLPTYLDAAEYTPPVMGYPLDGRSFLSGAPGRSEKYLEFGPVGRPTPVGYKGHRGIPTWASVRTGDYQYIEYYGTGAITPGSDNSTVTFGEYYDLHSDPWEIHNLVANPASASATVPNADLAALSAHLHQLEHCSGTTGPNACP